MSSQGAGASTDPLDLDEADRLAESIRPAWDLDEGQMTAPPAASATPAPQSGAEKVVAPDTGLATGGVDAAALDAAAQAFEPPRDTVIDGTPMIGVGKTDPGEPSDKRPSGEKKAAAAPRPEPPKAAAKTQLGLGADDEPRAISAPPPAPKPAPEPAARTKPGTGTEDPAPKSKPRRSRTSAAARDRSSDRGSSGPISEAKPIAGPAAGSTGPTFSRVDDPVEIPVEKGSKTAMYLGGAVLLVGAVVVGAMLFGGGGDEKPAPAKTPAPAETTQAEAPAPEPPKPAATETAAPAPEPTPTAEPEPTTTATAAPTSDAVAEAPKPADPPKAPSTPKTGSPPSGGTKPPSGGSKGGKGGIMRDAPF